MGYSYADVTLEIRKVFRYLRKVVKSLETVFQNTIDEIQFEEFSKNMCGVWFNLCGNKTSKQKVCLQNFCNNAADIPKKEENFQEFREAGEHEFFEKGCVSFPPKVPLKNKRINAEKKKNLSGLRGNWIMAAVQNPQVSIKAISWLMVTELYIIYCLGSQFEIADSVKTTNSEKRSVQSSQAFLENGCVIDLKNVSVWTRWLSLNNKQWKTRQLQIQIVLYGKPRIYSW